MSNSSNKPNKMEKATGGSLGEVVKKLEENGVLVSDVEKAAEEKRKAKAEKKIEQRAERLVAAEKYKQLKERVLKREKENYSEVILLQDKEKPGDKRKRWWKAFGHSAYILKYKIGTIHKLTYNIQEDTDFGVRSEEGVVLIPNLDNFLGLMKRKGYEVSKQAKECVVVSLGEELTVEQYEELVAIDETMERRLHSLIRPEEMVQDLNGMVKELDKTMQEMTRKMDAQSQEVYANAMSRTTVWLKVKLILVARGSYDFKKYLEEATDRVEELWGYLAGVMDRRSFVLE